MVAADASAVTRLTSDSIPVGIQTDADFPADSYRVPPGADILLYSDGAFELALPDGRDGSLADFIDLYSRSAGSAEWTLDALIGQLRTVRSRDSSTTTARWSGSALTKACRTTLFECLAPPFSGVVGSGRWCGVNVGSRVVQAGFTDT